MNLSELVKIAFLIESAVVCMHKWNIIESYNSRRPRRFPDWCTYCFAFWISCSIVGIQMHPTSVLVLIYQIPKVIINGLIVAGMVALIDRNIS